MISLLPFLLPFSFLNCEIPSPCEEDRIIICDQYDSNTSDNSVSIGALVAAGVLDENVSIGKKLLVKGKLVINRDYSFRGCDLIMADGAEIVVKSDVNFLCRTTYFKGCNNLWQGIKLLKSAKLDLFQCSISDADKAISFNFHLQNLNDAEDLLYEQNGNYDQVPLNEITLNLNTVQFGNNIYDIHLSSGYSSFGSGFFNSVEDADYVFTLQLKGFIANCTFLGGEIKPSYTGQTDYPDEPYSHTSITINQVSNTIIVDSDFSNYLVGVKANKCVFVRITNNNFTNIRRRTINRTKYGIAILASFNNSVSGSFNNFINIDKIGVELSGNNGANFSDNYFENIKIIEYNKRGGGKAIRIRNDHDVSSHSISRNFFNGCEIGVEVQKVIGSVSKVRIEDNEYIGVDNTIYYNPFDATDPVNLHQFGFKINSATETLIQRNKITLSSQIHDQTGIEVVGGGRLFALENEISMKQNSTNKRGVVGWGTSQYLAINRNSVASPKQLELANKTIGSSIGNLFSFNNANNCNLYSKLSVGDLKQNVCALSNSIVKNKFEGNLIDVRYQNNTVTMTQNLTLNEFEHPEDMSTCEIKGESIELITELALLSKFIVDPNFNINNGDPENQTGVYSPNIVTPSLIEHVWFDKIDSPLITNSTECEPEFTGDEDDFYVSNDCSEIFDDILVKDIIRMFDEQSYWKPYKKKVNNYYKLLYAIWYLNDCRFENSNELVDLYADSIQGTDIEVLADIIVETIYTVNNDSTVVDILNEIKLDIDLVDSLGNEYVTITQFYLDSTLTESQYELQINYISNELNSYNYNISVNQNLVDSIIDEHYNSILNKIISFNPTEQTYEVITNILQVYINHALGNVQKDIFDYTEVIEASKFCDLENPIAKLFAIEILNLSDRIYNYELFKDCPIVKQKNNQKDLSNSLKVYPNPIKDQLILNMKYDVKEFEIFDNLGKKWPCNINNNIINTTNLPSGIFYLKIENMDPVKLIKIE